LLERIAGAAAAGVTWIELREKDLDAQPLLDLARKAVSAARPGNNAGSLPPPPLVLVNDRLDVALAAGAGGVHLTETSVPVGAVSQWKRQAKRSDFLVGASCHSKEGALRAAQDGADYIFFGPVFATPSKARFGLPQGLAKLAEVCGAVDVPVLAIGGITLENAAACLQSGAAGIAAIGLFQQAADLNGLVADLRRRLP
jgi:thiamine-phosphate pyrophosphorylase